MIFTTGNIITLIICLLMLIVFRQLDKNNRSIEKVKKFGDKLKSDLDQYISDKTGKLDESTVALTVEQSKAVAAVKRLETIREDFAAKEQSLSERAAAIDEIGKKIASYDETVKQLLDMTARAEDNLSRITGESDFADSLGKKLIASQKQLAEISSSIPALKESFAEENKAALSALGKDALGRVGAEIEALEKKLAQVHAATEKTVAHAETSLSEVYKKALAEAARKADSLEDAAFAKLKEQAAERLAKYRESIEEKTAALHELTKERVHETQSLVKNFRTEWQAEAGEFLEATRAEILQFKSDFGDTASRIEEQVKSAESLAESRTESVRADFHALQSSLEQDFSSLASAIERRMSETIESSRLSAEASRNEYERAQADISASLSSLEAYVRKSVQEIASQTAASLESVSSGTASSVAALEKMLAETASGVEVRIASRLDGFAQESSDKIAAVEQTSASRLGAVVAQVDKALAEASRQTEEALSAAADKTAETVSAISRKTADAVAELSRKTAAETAEADKSFQERLAALSSSVRGELARIEAESKERLDAADALSEARKAELLSRLDAFSKNLAATLDTSSEKAKSHFAEASGAVEARLDAYRKDVEYRLAQFTSHLGDADRLEARLRETMEDTEKRVSGDFALYAKDMQEKQDQYERRMAERAEALSGKMLDLENGLNELKARAYDNVSEKLKVFEDDFFKDLAQRGDAINAELERWQRSVAEKLETLAAEGESARKDAEAAYEAELKERLASIGEQYRQHTARLEDQIATVESALRAQITASDQSILAFVEQFRAEFAQARDAASLHAKNELEAHALSVQEILRRQEREVDARTKEFIQAIDASKSEAEGQIESLRTDFGAWQAKNSQQLSAAREWLEDQLSSLSDEAKQSIESVSGSWQEQYRDFAAKTVEERKQLKDALDSLKREMAQSSAEFDRRSAEALAGFESSWKVLAAESETRLREQSADTDQTLRSLKALAQEIRDAVEQNREKSFMKVQQDTASLGATLEEIDRRQKAFIAQTKIFERADQLKIALDADIERLSGEVSRLDVYKESMAALEQQYIKIRKLEEEATQKLSRFTAEKKRIDILETDFGKLLGLSDSIDKKLLELTGTNDDLQQIQVQLRRFDETIGEVNSRYERLEKKALVLDRTVEGIDSAFEQLRAVESAVAGYRQTLESVPADLQELGRTLGELRDTGAKASLVMERISALDGILEDVEKRTEKMQTAREWLARTETRLEEISRQSQDQLKLLGDLLKEENPAKKSKGAPPIGIRENVVKLSHQGWKVDEIARALHLSRGEVELILELPSN